MRKFNSDFVYTGECRIPKENEYYCIKPYPEVYIAKSANMFDPLLFLIYADSVPHILELRTDDLPTGWEVIGYRPPKDGDWFMLEPGVLCDYNLYMQNIRMAKRIVRRKNSSESIENTSPSEINMVFNRVSNEVKKGEYWLYEGNLHVATCDYKLINKYPIYTRHDSI